MMKQHSHSGNPSNAPKYENGLKEARALLFQETQAFLSTLSARKAGFPFGSMVNYYFDQENRPLILISSIAQHSRNIAQNPEISILIQKSGQQDVQSAPRLSIFAKANLDSEEQGMAYFRMFPQGKEWHAMDFRFFQLEMLEAQYIGGPGKIAWLEGKDLMPKRICNEEEEEKFLSLISFDTQRAIAHKLNLHEEVIPVGMDAEGLDLKSLNRKARLHFSKPVSNIEEAREEILSLI